MSRECATLLVKPRSISRAVAAHPVLQRVIWGLPKHKGATNVKRWWRKYDGLFRNWQFGNYTIRHGDYCLWTCNGFAFFKDDDNHGGARTPLLRGLGPITRWRIWREYKRERRRRCLKAIGEMLI